MDTPSPIIKIEQKDFSDYPFLTRLLELHQIPSQIYIQGTIPTITFDEYGRSNPRILTVIGSRKNTSYGKQALENLIASLQGYNVIILSGLALGIDGLAHRIALKENLITIAIPGSGLGERVLYPSSHKYLRKEILDNNGLILSELPDDSPATPWTFPQTNRLMAALSDAVLVVEAEEKSGTLITAKLALELGKDIGAIPGDIFSPTQKGIQMLLRNGAYPITSGDDLLSLLHISPKITTIEKETTSLSQEEKNILELLREPIDKDALFSKTSLAFPEFISVFSSLEMKGYIEESFGEVRKIV